MLPFLCVFTALATRCYCNTDAVMVKWSQPKSWPQELSMELRTFLHHWWCPFRAAEGMAWWALGMVEEYWVLWWGSNNLSQELNSREEGLEEGLHFLQLRMKYGRALTAHGNDAFGHQLSVEDLKLKASSEVLLHWKKHWLKGTSKIISFWARTPSTRSGCSEPHPTWNTSRNGASTASLMRHWSCELTSHSFQMIHS